MIRRPGEMDEGIAMLRRLVDVRNKTSYWMVEFDNEPGSEYLRIVHRKDKVNERQEGI